MGAAGRMGATGCSPPSARHLIANGAAFLEMSMNRQVVVITGGGSGIGRAIALRFAKEGADVVVAGRNQAKLDAVADEVRALGAKCEVHAADISKASDAARLIEKTVSAFGHLDVLVNNAGNAVLASIEDIDVQAFGAMLAVNAAGPAYLSKFAFPVMKQHGGGTIINLSSMAAIDPFPGLGAYGATKAFVNILTKAPVKAKRTTSAPSPSVPAPSKPRCSANRSPTSRKSKPCQPAPSPT